MFSPYLGEAEAAVRQAFLLARNAAPALLFFDEIDAIVCKREGGGKVRDKQEQRQHSRKCELVVLSATDGGG